MCKTCKSKDCCCEQKIVYTSEPKIIEKIIVEKQCPGPRGLTGPRGPIGPEGPAGEGTTDYISEITASATYYNYFFFSQGLDEDNDNVYIKRESDDAVLSLGISVGDLSSVELDAFVIALSAFTGETWAWEEYLYADYADKNSTSEEEWINHFKVYCTTTSVLDYYKIIRYDQADPWAHIIHIYRDKISDVLTITGVGNAFNGTLELPVHPRNIQSYIQRVEADRNFLEFAGVNDGFNGTINIFDLFRELDTYADDTAAGVGGLVQGDIYQTATGELRIKL
jgi:hypothetical protein